MNAKILPGRFHANIKTYRSKDGKFCFAFDFVSCGAYIDIYCTERPSLNGKDSNPHKTHLYPSGKVCFIKGKEPKTQSQAERLAAQWAEYYLEYRKTGKAQS